MCVCVCAACARYCIDFPGLVKVLRGDKPCAMAKTDNRQTPSQTSASKPPNPQTQRTPRDATNKQQQQQSNRGTELYLAYRVIG